MEDTENIRIRRVRQRSQSEHEETSESGGAFPDRQPSEVSSPEPESLVLSMAEGEHSATLPTEDSPLSRAEMSTDIQTEEEHEDIPEDKESPYIILKEEEGRTEHSKDVLVDDTERSDADNAVAKISEMAKSPPSEGIEPGNDTQRSSRASSSSRPLMKTYAPPWERSSSLINPVLNPPVVSSTTPTLGVDQSPVHGRSPAKPSGSGISSEGTDRTLSSHKHSHSTNNANDQDADSCCTKLALNMYSRAKDFAARPSSALFKAFKGHKTDQKDDNFPHSQGGFLALDGFTRMDEEATESSDDYMDIEFRRESVFKPEIIYLTKAYDQIPPVRTDEDEDAPHGDIKKTNAGPSVIPLVVETPSTPDVAPDKFTLLGSPERSDFLPARPITPEEEADFKQQVEDSLKEIDRVQGALQEARGPEVTFDYHYPNIMEHGPAIESNFVAEKVRFKDDVVKPEFPSELDFHENYPIDAAHDIDIRKYGGVVQPSEAGRSKAVPLSKEASLEETPEYITRPPKEKKTIAQSMIILKDKINVGIKGMLKPTHEKEKVMATQVAESGTKTFTQESTPSKQHDKPVASQSHEEKNTFVHMKEHILEAFKSHQMEEKQNIDPTDMPKSESQKTEAATESSTSPKDRPSSFMQMKEHIKEVFKPHEAPKDKKPEALQLPKSEDETYEIPVSLPLTPTSPKEKINFAHMKQQIKDVFKSQEFSKEIKEVPSDTEYAITQKGEDIGLPKEKTSFAQMKEHIKDVFKPHEPKDKKEKDSKKATASVEGEYDIPVVVDLREPQKTNVTKEKKGLSQIMGTQALKEKLGFKDSKEQHDKGNQLFKSVGSNDGYKSGPVIKHSSETSYMTDTNESQSLPKPFQKQKPPRPEPPKVPYQGPGVFPYYYRGWNDNGSMSTEDVDDFRDSTLGQDATEEPSLEFAQLQPSEGEFFSEPEDLRELHDETFAVDTYRRKSVDHVFRCMGPLPQHPLRPPRNKIARKGGRIGYPSPQRPFPHELPVLKPGNPDVFKPLARPFSAKPEDTNHIVNKLSLSPRLAPKNMQQHKQQYKLSPFATTERPPKSRVLIVPKGEKPKVPPKPKLPKYYPVYILVPGIPLSSKDRGFPPPRPPPPPPNRTASEGNSGKSHQLPTESNDIVMQVHLSETGTGKEMTESQIVLTSDVSAETEMSASKEEQEYQKIIEQTLREVDKLKTTDSIQVAENGENIQKDDTVKVESIVEQNALLENVDELAEQIVKEACKESTEMQRLPNQFAEQTTSQVNDKPPVPLARRKSARTPKPPPRGRRNRSRTVEIYPVTPKPEEGRRRSQSLSDDVAAKLVDRFVPSEQPKENVLYTQIQKPARTKSKSKLGANSSISRMQERPLPPPPPPPRSRSRSSAKRTTEPIQGGSLDRNYRAKQNGALGYAIPLDTRPVFQSTVDMGHKERQTIGVDENANIETAVLTSKTEFVQVRSAGRSCSQPKQNNYRNSTFYCDTGVENGNILLGKDDVPGIRKPMRKKQRAWSTGAIDRPESISPYLDRNRSSWYDDEGSSGTFGDVDTSITESVRIHQFNPDGTLKDKKLRSAPPPPTAQRKKKAKGEMPSKDKRTSKFYCDLKAGESEVLLPELTDKAVQTVSESETADTVDKDDRSEDTDELIDLTNNLRNELKQLLERRKHRREGDSSKTESDTYRTASAGPDEDSQKALVRLREPHQEMQHSSTSEVSWNETSEVDSGDDLVELEFEDPIEVVERKRKRKAYYIARELMTSEEVFVNALKLLNEDFRRVVRTAGEDRGGPIIPEEVLNQIFGSLPQLQQLNENLLRELKERVERWEEFPKVADIIVKMGPFLKLYSSYIRDFETITSTLEESCRRYPAFAQVITEFEKSPRCQMLALKAYMLKPVQRIPQYRLLLQDYLRHLTEGSLDFEDTKTALNIVSEVAGHANESMKQGDNLSKLVAIQNSIWGRYEIIKPGREFIKEGELMKLSRSKMQPRRFILFSDCFMYLTPVQYGLYRINHELSLTGMRVSIPVQQDYQNEFSVISVTRSFTLAAKSPEERQDWINALNKAIEENASKRSTFLNIRLQQMGEEQSGHPCILGRQAPVWIPDARVTMCQVCTSEFTVTFRRHHCRACGKVVCYACSSNKAPLHYLRNRPARVCDECFENLQQEFESITYGSGMRQDFTSETESGENEEAFTPGQSMALVKSGFKGNIKTVGKRMRRYLPKVLKEVCANDQGSTISGYLMRRTGKRCWKRYWFVIKDKVIYTYKASEDVAALESIPLLGFQVETFTEPLDGIDPSIVFQLSHPNHPPFIFHSESPGSAERWVKAMQEGTILE